MDTQKTSYSLRTFLPLISIIGCIIALTTITSYMRGATVHDAMYYFMGYFFLIFGGFKLMRWNSFVTAYKMYDILAQRSTVYAYMYPLIELSLGYAYLTQSYLTLANYSTLLIMSIGILGVTKELLAGRTITCACLGTVFKFPMTWVTLAEDLVMASMALLAIVW